MIQVQIMTELSSHYLPATLKKLQDMVVKNSSGSGWIVGQNVSLWNSLNADHAAVPTRIENPQIQQSIISIPYLEQILITQKYYYHSPQVTYADLAITILLDALSQYKPEILLAFTTLAQLKKNVEELPNIAKWIAKRPDTQHWAIGIPLFLSQHPI